MYHSRLAQLIAIKKREQYAKTISWIRTRTSFALLRSALVCLRGSTTRRVPCECWYWRRSCWRSHPIGLLMCFLTFKWQISVINTLWTLFNFPLFWWFFLVIILVGMQLTLKIVSSFLFEMNCFNWNEMFLIWIIFV